MSNKNFITNARHYSGVLVAFEGNTCCGKGVITRLMAEHLENKGFAPIIMHEPQSECGVGKFIRAYIDGKDFSDIKKETIEKMESFFMHIGNFIAANPFFSQIVLSEKEDEIIGEFLKTVQDAYLKIKGNCHVRLATGELQALYVVDRWFHIQELIFPRLEAGMIVLEDRFWLSTLTYGSAFGVPLEKLWAWHVCILRNFFLFPDVHILMDVAPEVSFQRLKTDGKTKDIHENTLTSIIKTWDAYCKAVDFVNNEFSKMKIWNSYKIVIIDANAVVETVLRSVKKEIKFEAETS
jgi:thymidylate kinase